MNKRRLRHAFYILLGNLVVGALLLQQEIGMLLSYSFAAICSLSGGLYVVRRVKERLKHFFIGVVCTGLASVSGMVVYFIITAIAGNGNFLDAVAAGFFMGVFLFVLSLWFGTSLLLILLACANGAAFYWYGADNTVFAFEGVVD